LENEDLLTISKMFRPLSMPYFNQQLRKTVASELSMSK